MAEETKVRYSGSWRDCVPEVKSGGAWRNIASIEVKSGGVWRSVLSSGPVVSMRANGDWNKRTGASCYVGPTFINNGDEYEYTPSGGLGSLTTWLDSGNAADVWIQHVKAFGTWQDLDPGTARLQMSTTRSWRAVKTTFGFQTVAGYWKMYDAASGGNLLQQTSQTNWTSEYQ